jgi:hypothetical protein
MKRLLMLVSILCWPGQARAEEETWISSENGPNSSYFAPTLRFSQTAGALGVWPGIRFGWVTGSVLSAGLEGYFLASDVQAEYPVTERLHMAVGGVLLEAIAASDQVAHTTFSVLIGAGGTNTGPNPDLDTMSMQSFLVMEPAINMEFNITRHFRISPGVSYRWISGDVAGVISKWSVSETSFHVAFKIRDY